MKKISSNRLASIDVIRALTMLLMIFVNDLWTLTDIPAWLGHASADEDQMGLADIVFPAFMFIIGLSIPHALKARLKKGESKRQVFIHIVTRSFALIVMGLYMVNLENIDKAALLIDKAYWQIMMFFAFVMIWNNYRSPKILRRIPSYVLKIAGWGILIFLAVIYEGNGGSWMQIHWWGILGLLGWAYLLCAVVYLVIGDKILGIAIATILLLLMNVNEFVGFNFKIVIAASNYFSVMLGVFSTVIYSQMNNGGENVKAIWVLLGLALDMLLIGVFTRPEWGISKIRATPSWATICAGISLLSFLLLYVVADIKKMTAWSKPIAAGGYATLTCYLIPYLVYAIRDLAAINLPLAVTTGVLGLIKSFLFALLIIQIAEWVGKLNIRMKI